VSTHVAPIPDWESGSLKTKRVKLINAPVGVTMFKGLLLLQAAADGCPVSGRVYHFSVDSSATRKRMLRGRLGMTQYHSPNERRQIRKQKCSRDQSGLCLNFLLLQDTLKSRQIIGNKRNLNGSFWRRSCSSGTRSRKGRRQAMKKSCMLMRRLLGQDSHSIGLYGPWNSQRTAGISPLQDKIRGSASGP
jgi:hypothetical protein